MGLFADVLRGMVPAVQRAAPPLVSASGRGSGALTAITSATGFVSNARKAYLGNELAFAAIDLLATSAAEPQIVGRRYVNGARKAAAAQERALKSAGAPRYLIPGLLEQRGFLETVTEHPLLTLLNRPNPFASRFQLWSTVIMDRYLAGNAYLYVTPSTSRPQELWRLRPDRVRVVPDRKKFIAGYEYRIGQETVSLRPDQVLHFKTRHPLDDYYGMSALQPLMGRLDIDNYMREFVGAFFERGGLPGAVLAIKQKLSQEAKDELRERSRRQFGGPSGWFEWLILDQTEASFTTVTQSLGRQGLAAPELNAVTEARIAAAFGIPASILGPLVGLESSSYANKRADWQVFWDVTLAPLYSDLDDVLNRAFGMPDGGLDEVIFDLSQIKALQEDVDKLHERARANVAAGLWTQEEGRLLTGVEAEAKSGFYLLPVNLAPTPAGEIGTAGEVLELPEGEEPGLRTQGAGLTATYEGRCSQCAKLCARDVPAGTVLWCRRCKAEFRVSLQLAEPAAVLAAGGAGGGAGGTG